MGRSATTKDAQALFHSLRSAYAATPNNLKIIDLYIVFAVVTAVIQLVESGENHGEVVVHVVRQYSGSSVQDRQSQIDKTEPSYLGTLGLRITVVYMAIVGSFPFNSFLSGVLSCVGTAVLAVSLRIQVNKENKEFKDLPPERAFADFVLCNLVLHLVIMNFLG
ncbi:UNVERIFIED_CONTAM: Dolichyl-diphosphooligosaccharide--protein glycosyltransferase subunit DAD1 [Sesamum radiatum]|uniref:Dolichyl-diphosphooligosaccharide--protein glycosyltransferase subunit DAD1 n=1 Tax=Sesamum radiatum TaxID=300843 RepID=A0AAW2JNS2_SESRA